MSQSLAHLLTHIIFSTKNREPFLKTQPLRDVMNRYIGGTLREMHCPSIIVNGVEDHVHILCLLSKNIALKDLLKQIKESSSKWIKTQDPSLKEFYWQGGYAAFSVSESNVSSVSTYIAGQEEHHRRTSFQDEMRMFFRKHSMDFDERYVWD